MELSNRSGHLLSEIPKKELFEFSYSTNVADFEAF